MSQHDGKGSTPAMPTPDGAIFRSMKMSTGPPPPRLLSMNDVPQKEPLSAARTISSPVALSAGQPSGSEWVWKMDNQLPAVPFYHPLERTAVTIEDVTLDTLTARLSRFMKARSITCAYHDESGRVDCLTDRLVKFVVQLWQGTPPKTDAIIVEIQRRQGCCIEMQGLRCQLIQAMRDGVDSPPQENHSRKTCEFLESIVDKTACPPPPGECFPSAMKLCHQFLESSRVDERRLGLESLCMLTDPSKVNAPDADKASNAVLSDPRLNSHLQSFLVDFEVKSSVAGDDDQDDLMDYHQGQFFGCLHLLALKTLSNALESAASRSGKQGTVLISDDFWQTALQAFFYNLSHAPRRPLEASLSARCLRFLQAMEPQCLSMASSESRLYECLLSAHNYGREHSQLLQSETEELMGKLGSVH